MNRRGKRYKNLMAIMKRKHPTYSLRRRRRMVGSRLYQLRKTRH